MGIAAGLLKFIALNGATLVAAFGFASRLRLDSRAERLLAACVVAVGLANASALVLGLVGSLSYWPLLGTQSVFAVAAIAVARWGVVAQHFEVGPLAQIVRGWPQRLTLASIAAVYAYAAFLGCISESFGGDELMYHLPLLAEYAREGRIGVPELGTYWANRYWAWYPGGAYLLYLWFVLPFGSGAFVDLVQLPYACGAALAAYVLARMLGARRHDAVWAAPLFLAVPIVVNQMKTALVDVLLAFLFSAGLAFLLSRSLTPARIALAAIAWGAAPGVKLPAAMFMAGGAVAVALRQWEGRSVRDALRTLVPAGAAVAAGVALLSGFWFARNWWLMGSAVYPLNLRPEPPIAWTNIIYYGLLFPLLDYSPFAPDLFNYETGAGPQFIGLAVPALLALAVTAVRQRRGGIAAAAILPIAAYFVWLFRLSTSVQTLLRYVVPAMPFGFAAFAWLLTRGPHRRWLVGLAIACIAFSLLVSVPHLGTYTNVASLRAGLAQWRDGEVAKRFDVMGAVDLQDYRRAWNFIESLAGSHDIAASHLIFAYPMMGADFRHRLHFPTERRPGPWLDELGRRGVDHVALAELVDQEGSVLLGRGIALEIVYKATADENLLVSRRVSRRPVTALRLRYHTDGAENLSAFVGVNQAREVWELPPAAGEERTESIAWRGDLESVELLLELVPRTSLRTTITLIVDALDVQGEDGAWAPLLGHGAENWEVLRWPLEYYWMEQRPERFRLVLRDVDHWRSPVSGEMRIYQVLPLEGDDGA